MKTRIIIPARLKSSRFPGKLVQKINDITLIEHIVLRAKKLPHDSITVATDDDKIKNLVEKHNINVWFSKKKYINGTHRIASLCRDLKYMGNDNILNIQGDEFNFPLKGARDIISSLSSENNISMYTLISRSKSEKSFNSKDAVKVILDNQDNALYFSRSPIPFNVYNDHYLHIGIYGYKVSLLKKYLNFKSSPYESYESLEQLKFIWNQIPIRCIKVRTNNSISVNSPSDLKLAKDFLK